MVFISETAIDEWLKEDLPYLDLTTWMLGIGSQMGRIQFYCREQTVLCGTEEVERIFQRLGVTVNRSLPSGSLVEPEQTVLEAAGAAGGLHGGWKIALNILEYASGIASRTRKLVALARQVQPGIAVVTTRKSFPGTKELAVKAILTGGALPHRLGLSETVLIFEQHRAFFKGFVDFCAAIPKFKEQACEKKIILEAVTLEEAVAYCRAGADGIQFDKVAAMELRHYVQVLREINPHIVVIAAGGIHENNIADYAGTGVDAIATSAAFFGKPADFGVRMTANPANDKG